MADYVYVGKSLPPKDSGEKVAGRSLYAADFHLTNMLCGKLLHSPVSHARIANIDKSRALKYPGVKAVITAEDTPCIRVGHRVQDRTLLAWKKVRYAGEPVAAVAAVDEETAQEALELIRMEYEELPAVFDPLLAMKPDSPLVHEEKNTYEPAPGAQPLVWGKGNILEQHTLTMGNPEQALRDADYIYQNSYRTPVVHQGFIEPHAVVANVDPSGRATLWCSTKTPYTIRSQTAKFLRFPVEKLRVIAPAVGGDFGGKGSAYIEPVCLLLSLKARLPVKLVLGQDEEMVCTFMRDSSIIELTVGARRDGTLLVIKGQMVIDSGAYCDHVVGLNPGDLTGGYRIPHINIANYAVYTNNTPRGHVRAPRAPYPIFAIESHMDMLAQKLGIDPIQFRLKNAVQEGDRLPEGFGTLGPVGFKATLQAAAAYLKENKKERQPNHGWGVACGKWGAFNTPPICSAVVKINLDASATLITGATDPHGCLYGAMAQIVSEVLSIPYDCVNVIAADTEITPFEMGTGGSFTTYRVGASVKLAAEDARRKILQQASLKLEAPAEALDLKGGRIFIKTMPERGLSLAAIAAPSAFSPGGQIIGTGDQIRASFMSNRMAHMGEIDSACYSTHVAEVEVDPETGQVQILRYFAAHDAGFAINPDNVKKQIEGGVVFGMGYALTEEVKLEQGKTLNDNLTDYKLPTTTMVPPVESAIIEVPTKFGPYGARGIGEPPSIPVAPAIANAIYDATVARLTELPMTPERVFAAMKRSRE